MPQWGASGKVTEWSFTRKLQGHRVKVSMKYAKQGRPANTGTPLFGTQCFPHLLYQTISDSSVETLGYSNSTPTERYKVDFKQIFSAFVPWERTSHLRTFSPKFLILREEKKKKQFKTRSLKKVANSKQIISFCSLVLLRNYCQSF